MPELLVIMPPALPVVLPTVCAKLAKSYVPVAPTDNAVAVGNAFATPFARVPVETVVAPVYVLPATLMFHVPVPLLVSEPLVPVVIAVVLMLPAAVPVPVPVNVNALPVPVTPPVKVSAPVLVPEASSEPPLVPSVIERLVEVALLPVYCNVPPLMEMAGVTEPVPIELLLPDTASAATFKIPPVIDTAPVKVLTASPSVSLPVLLLVKFNEPLINPEYESDAPLVLSVKVAAVPLSVIVPVAPFTLPTCCAKALRSKVPPAMVKAVVLVRAFAMPSLTVPEFSVVAPLYEFAPESINVPDPPMVKAREPVNVPA